MPLEFGIEPPHWLTGAVAQNTDPLRPLREEQAKNSILQQTVQLEGEYSKLRQQNKDLAQWQNESTAVASWMQSALDPNKPLGAPPPVTSTTGMSNVEKIYQMREKAETARALAEARKQNFKANQSKNQFYQDWTTQFVADPQLTDEINALRQADPTLNEYGWRTDASGNPIGPTQEAAKAMRESTDRRKLPPLGTTKEQLQFETKEKDRLSKEKIATDKNQAAMDRLVANAGVRLAISDEKNLTAEKIESMRIEGQEHIEAIKLRDKETFAKVQSQIKVDEAREKSESWPIFADRHLKEFAPFAPGATLEERNANAIKMAISMFDSVHKSAPDKAPPQRMPPSWQKPGTKTNDDPLGLFK